jgi:hypothetical protein
MRNKPQQEWLCVLELNQAAAPRRNPSLERLLVKRVRTQPGPELKKQVTTNNRWMKKGVVRFREDLMPKDTQPGGRLRPFELPRDAEKARAAEDALRDALLAQGYTVNGHMKLWKLYVVELEYTPPARGKKKIGRVYVGQTTLQVNERIEQHRLGPNYKPGYKKYNNKCYELFGQPRLDLLPAWARADFYCECDALRAEGCLRLHFEDRGYHVDGGTELVKGKPHKCGKIDRKACRQYGH